VKINQYGNIPNNPYQKQMKQQSAVQNTQGKKQDQIEISSKALELQKSDGLSSARKDKVNALRNQIDSGAYQINQEKVAEKFLEFWKK
jgi:negative regulator of flagellin synthesis FlgM